MHIITDATRCIGAGQCVLAAPEIFDQDDDALVIVADQSPGDSDRPRVQQAVDQCPSGAIALAEN